MATTISLLHVRRSIFIQASPARVWEEFASFDRFSAWFGRGHELHHYEPKVGSRVDLSAVLDGERQHFGGPIIVLEPERELTFESNWVDASLAWPQPTFFTIRLTGLYDGTLAEIYHHGFERFGADAAEALEDYESGWDVKHLKALRAIVEQ